MSFRRAGSILFFLALGLGLDGAAFAWTFERSYADLETTLLSRLDLNGKDPAAGPTRAWIGDRGLASCLGFSGCVQVTRYEAGERLQLRMEERYDIGAVGGRSLVVDLRRLDARRTRVEADYADRAIGFFVIPFAYANPGWIRQAGIESCLVRLEGPPKEADQIRRPPARRPEPACERLQGLSCGPPGAVLACDTASGWPLRCTCSKGWDCR